jgi:hypothetical protein
MPRQPRYQPPPPYGYGIEQDYRAQPGCATGCALAILRVHHLVWRLAWRYRDMLKPFGVAAGVLVVTLAVRVAYASRWTWQPLAILAVLSVAAAAALWFGGQHLRLDRAPERAYATAVALAAGVWAQAAYWFGPLDPPMLGWLLLTTLGGGVPWWWHRRIRRRVEAGIGQWKADLEQHEQGSSVGRSRFDPDGGCAIPWTLAPGRTIEGVRPEVGRLESMLDLRPGAIEIDQDEGRKRLVWLRISPRDPHAQALVYPGPPRDASITRPVAIGRYLDGGATSTPLLGQQTLISGATGSGKALALDTPIPTPTGWTTMRWLRPGDQVFDEQGQPCTVVAATDVQHGRTCYEVVFSDGNVIIADAEHRWLTSTREARLSERKYQARRARPVAHDQMGRRVLPTVVTTEQIQATLTANPAGGRPYANHSIPLTKPLQYPASDLSVDPYVLGAWLGDGRTRDAEITTADPEILAEIKAAGYEVTAAETGKPLQYRIGSGCAVALRALGVLGDKHIPRDYLHGSPVQRLALLQGLMDTDGTVGKGGSCEFSVTKRILAEQTLELVVGLGIKAKLRTRPVRWKGKDCGIDYRIHFTTEVPVFRLPRKLLRQKQAAGRSTQRQRYIVDVRPVPSVPVRCIQVNSLSRLYLAGRGCISTHNSGVVNVIVAYLAACPDVVLWGCDLKHGLELGPWAPVFGRIATTPEQAAELLEAAVRVKEARGEEMARRVIRSWPVSPDTPALVVVIDEHKALAGNKRAIAAIETLTAQGRAMTVSVLDSTQYPINDALGSPLIAPQMSVKVCLRVNTPGEANVILGPGSARAGWAAHQIPKGKPGTLYLDAPGADTPRLARAYHVTDQMVERLARAYSGRRPRLDPGSEQAAGLRGSPPLSPPAGPPPSPLHGPLPAHPAGPPRSPLDSPAERPPAGPPPSPAGERDPVAILLDALEAAGERGATVAELAVAVGMRKTWVYDRLGELADAGRVARGPHSRWFRQPPDEGGLQTR